MIRNLPERRAVLVLPQKRQHLAAEPAHFTIGQNRFEPITDFCPVFPIIHREQHHNAAIFALGTHAPLFEQAISEIRRRIPFEGMNRHHRQLRIGFLIKLLG